MPIPRERHENVRDQEEQGRAHDCSISFLKLRRYLSTRRETAPPKLEASFNVIRVLRTGWDTNETTPLAKWAGAWPSEIVRQARRRSWTRNIISSVVSYCLPLKPSDAVKWLASSFRTR